MCCALCRRGGETGHERHPCVREDRRTSRPAHLMSARSEEGSGEGEGTRDEEQRNDSSRRRTQWLALLGKKRRLPCLAGGAGDSTGEPAGQAAPPGRALPPTAGL